MRRRATSRLKYLSSACKQNNSNQIQIAAIDDMQLASLTMGLDIGRPKRAWALKKSMN